MSPHCVNIGSIVSAETTWDDRVAICQRPGISLRPDTAAEPIVSVDTSLGAAVRELGGSIIDYDPELLRDAALQGGLKEDDFHKTHFVIKYGPTGPMRGAFAGISNHDEEGREAAEHYAMLYTNGHSPITAAAVAHEARHYADYLHRGDAAFLSKARRIGRKAVAVTLAVTNAGFSAGLLAKGDASVVPMLHFAVASDLSVASVLGLEYFLRGEERRARKAERGAPRKNILITDAQPPQVNAVYRYGKSALRVARAVVVPDFHM